MIILVVVVIVIVKSHNDATSKAIVDNPINVSGTVCIDAGHGGSDTGAISTDGTMYEKDDNLKLALKVREYLENMGIDVVMTRDDDTNIDLNERCKIANSYDTKIDLFISLHRNSAENTSARGVEIWIHNSKPPVDIALAENILNYLMSIENQESRGIEYGYRGDSSENYRVNKLTTMPSCLVETGFISNTEDVKIFNEHLDDFAMSISLGIYQTLEDIAKGSVDTSRGKAGQNWD
ncbi:MAG: N-acetylmuramoyl-L-alanine amidase [Oscillospiraceae bacterium]